MEQLLIALARLLLRLILFAWTGDWRKLEKLQEQLRELLQKRDGTKREPGAKREPGTERGPGAKREPGAKRRPTWGTGPGQSRERPGTRDRRAPRQARGRTPEPGEEAWPFEFAPELTAEEPMGELQGGESVTPLTVQPRPGSSPRPARALVRSRPSLAAQLRQPRIQREAMILTAVLGPRRDPRRG